MKKSKRGGAREGSGNPNWKAGGYSAEKWGHQPCERGANIQLWMSPDEKASIKERATANGLSMTEFLLLAVRAYS